MNRNQYLADPDVNNFINWLGPKLDVDFSHSYNLPDGTLWTCASIINYHYQMKSICQK